MARQTVKQFAVPDDFYDMQASVIDSCDSGLIVVDENMNVVLWNDWMELHSGVPASSALGQKISKVFPVTLSMRLNSAIEQSLKFSTSALLSPGLNPYPFPLFKKHIGDVNDRMQQSIIIKPVKNSQDQPASLIQVFNLSNAFKRESLLRQQIEIAIHAKEEAENLSRLKSEFTAMVSHELRTPLTAILGSIKLIQNDVIDGLPKTLKTVIDIAARNSDRLLMIINDLLDIHKIEAGKMEYLKVPVTLMSLIEKSVDMNSVYAEGYQVTYRIDKDSPDAMVVADGDRVVQVITNLLSNAAKFSPAGSDVLISTVLVDGKIVTSISDKGQGIPEEFHNKIFVRFSQADSSDTRAVGGTGLGLSISKSIMEHHDGDIWFETEVGAGTTFSFSLDVES